jgi:predicted secreted hydrolase
MVAARRRILKLILLLSGIALVDPVPAADETREFRIATEGYRYEFPRDHGAHEAFRTEWWYYTGNLFAKDGRAYGYQLTFFRRGTSPDQVRTLPSQWSITQLYLAHFAVTDLPNGRFRYAEKVSRAGLGKAGAEPGRLRVWIDRWSAEMPPSSPGLHRLTAAEGDLAIDLTLAAEKAPVVHGANGISRKGAGTGQASHYYSFTRLATSGRLTVGKQSFDVTGTSWMDHEFGSADLAQELVGWDWFSVQLDDRSELMLYRLRRADGSVDPASSGTVVLATGETRHIPVTDMTVEATESWTSPASRATYPHRWQVGIPSMDLKLEIVPLLADQELRTSRSTQVTYWEGAVAVTGLKQGHPVRGRGYVELTGYAARITQKL